MIPIFITFFLFISSCFALDKRIDYNDFEGLMGKGTSHWAHLQQDGDWALFHQIQSLYQKNKDAQFTAAAVDKIPPVIHVIWLGPRTFPPKSVENLRSWIAYHPEWKIKFWTDRERDPPCAGIEMCDVRQFTFLRLKNCFDASQNWAEKSDVLRYEILFQEGGIYVDHDAYCIASFEGLVKGYDFFCCLEAPHEAFVGVNLTAWNGLIGSRPGHPAMEKVIDLVFDRWNSVGQAFRGRDAYSKVEVVMQRTYIAFTQALEGTLALPGNVDIVFPAAYFFAKSGIPSVYSKHFCLTTWDEYKSRSTDFEKFSEKSLRNIDRKSTRFLVVSSVILLISSLFLGLTLWQLKRTGKKI